MLPRFLIVGAMRCGTTALARMTGAHPNVFIPPAKELHFFDHRWARGVEWYERQFAAAMHEGVVGEATPGYLYCGTCSERIAEVLPTVRLIAILRNPVDRAYSHYWHNRRRGIEPRSFEEALAAERKTGPSVASREPERYAYLAKGAYVAQLRRYERHFACEQLLVLLNRDLDLDPHAALRTVWEHVGADTPGQTMDQLLRPWTNPSVERRLRRLRRGKWRGHRPQRFAYPPMAESTRADLLVWYAAEVDAAEEYLDRPLPHWRV